MAAYRRAYRLEPIIHNNWRVHTDNDARFIVEVRPRGARWCWRVGEYFEGETQNRSEALLQIGIHIEKMVPIAEEMAARHQAAKEEAMTCG